MVLIGSGKIVRATAWVENVSGTRESDQKEMFARHQYILTTKLVLGGHLAKDPRLNEFSYEGVMARRRRHLGDRVFTSIKPIGPF